MQNLDLRVYIHVCSFVFVCGGVYLHYMCAITR